jgi:hypothetical protein
MDLPFKEGCGMRFRKFVVPVVVFCLFSTLLSYGQATASTSLPKSDRMVNTFHGTATGTFQPDHAPATAFASKAFTIVATADPEEFLNLRRTVLCLQAPARS